jgi:hypothetical protein
MRIPEFPQLTLLREYVLWMMQHHSGLLEALQPAKAEHVLRRVYPFRIFYQGQDGIKVEKVDMPCIGIYPRNARREYVHGHMGFKCTLGVQFLFQARQPDREHTLEGAANHHLHLIWWVLCEILQSPVTFMSDSGIHRLYPTTMDVLSPLANAVRGFDGGAEIEYNVPPYPYRGAVDLESIYGTYDLTDSDGVTIEDGILGSVTDGLDA